MSPGKGILEVVSLMMSNTPDDWCKRLSYELFMLIKHLRDNWRGKIDERDQYVYKFIESMKDIKIDPQNKCFRIEVHETNAQILRSRLRVGEPLMNHVNKILSLFECLSLLGSPIQEGISVYVLINSLHDGYERSS